MENNLSAQTALGNNNNKRVLLSRFNPSNNISILESKTLLPKEIKSLQQLEHRDV